jgi:hypothetical protein
MKRFAKTLGVTCAALALSAITAAGASAHFTASATGLLTGVATSVQVFKPSASGSQSVTCNKAHTTGTITFTAASSLHVTVAYSECTAHTAIGTFAANVSSATYNLTTNGEIHILNTITINIPALGCKTSVGPQTVSGVSYHNKTGRIEKTNSITGIASTSDGLCPSGTTGTFTGSGLIERISGGTLSHHP